MKSLVRIELDTPFETASYLLQAVRPFLIYSCYCSLQPGGEMIATLLLLLLSPGDINVRTRQNLAAMQNISALQVGDKESYRVGVFKGVSRPAPIPHKGVYFSTEWYSLLQDSQKWTLVPRENYFIYTSQCWWSELNRGSGEWAGWVPCEGEVYVDSEDNIMRIVQRLAPKRMVTNATMIIDYVWVELKARRLVP